MGMRLLLSGLSCLMVIFILKFVPSPTTLPLAIACSFAFPAVWFSTRLFELDMTGKKVFVGTWVMGFRFGKTYQYKTFDILKRQEKIKGTIFNIDNKQVLFTKEYRLILVLDGSTELFLLSHPIEGKIDERLAKLKKLQLQ